MVPWARLISRHTTKQHRGRPQMRLALMLRIYFLQQWCHVAKMHARVDAESERGLPASQKKRNCKHGAVRAKAEHVFASSAIGGCAIAGWPKT